MWEEVQGCKGFLNRSLRLGLVEGDVLGVERVDFCDEIESFGVSFWRNGIKMVWNGVTERSSESASHLP